MYTAYLEQLEAEDNLNVVFRALSVIAEFTEKHCQ